MPHSFVVAQLDPQASVYWIPPSGQRAAARIPTKSFWALRVSLHNNDDWSPNLLFVVSSHPSPYPFQNASFTFGPKVDPDSDDFWDSLATLTVTPPIHTCRDFFSSPLFVHTVPRLTINHYDCGPIKKLVHQLDDRSLAVFRNAAKEVYPLARQFHDRLRLVNGKTGGPEAPREGWSTYRGETGMELERGDPRSYLFDFWYEGSLPSMERFPLIYTELRLLKQVFKDYRWIGVEETIKWVQDTRQYTSRKASIAGNSKECSVNNTRNLDQAWQEASKTLRSLQYPHRTEHDIGNQVHVESITSSHETASWSSVASDSSKYQPWMFPHLFWKYNVIPLGDYVKIVVFDLFGTILDREGAIKKALEPWAALSHSHLDPATLTERYIELEAHLDLLNSKSLADNVYRTLIAFARKLCLPIPVDSELFMSALTCILEPRPFPEAEAALTILAERGYMLLCIPPKSQTTTEQLHRVLPRAFLKHVKVLPSGESIHFTGLKAGTFLGGVGLYQQCWHLYPGGIAPAEILVVSTGIGRILANAMKSIHQTALVRRLGNMEGNVEFVVGDRKGDNPTPSVIVGDLMELCAKLEMSQA